MARSSAKRPAATPGTNGSGEKTMSKSAAVRAALALGADMPEEGVAFIKERYGIAITRPQFSVLKSHIRKREGAGKAGMGAGKSTTPSQARNPPGDGARRSSSSSSPSILAALESVKALVDRHGADGVRRMVDLVG